MSAPADPALARFKALAAGYRLQACQDLQQQRERLDGTDSDGLALRDLESLLHRLAGSAGSFGFPEAGQRARALQLQLREPEAPAQALPLAVIEAQLRDIQALFELHALPTDGPGDWQTDSSDAAPIDLLEDEPAVAAELIATFEQFGYLVRHFRDTATLDAAWAEARPEALVVDLTLGGDTRRGIDAARELRARHGLRVPLLCLSKVDDFSTRLAAARVGARGFFVKPLDPLRLVDRIESLRQEREARPHRVLLLDDDQLLAEHYGAVLEAHGFQVHVLAAAADALPAIEAFQPDLVLLDMYMPGCSGPELARVIRTHDDGLALPIVFLSAETDLDRQIIAASEGIDDFLNKPISDGQLAAALRARCERARSLGELMQRDSLTGLLKHSRIKEQLLVEVARAERSGRPLAVAMLDIDRFKTVNDSHGHVVGDRVIRAIAHLMRQRVRRIDSVGRYGGEEFVLLLPDCDTAAAEVLLNDIRERFAALRFAAPDGGSFSVTVSAGVVTTGQYSGAGELLTRADQALYRAKQEGRNRVCIG
jgi:diguanylate cyclase (GGDEF)-like protein